MIIRHYEKPGDSSNDEDGGSNLSHADRRALRRCLLLAAARGVANWEAWPGSVFDRVGWFRMQPERPRWGMLCNSGGKKALQIFQKMILLTSCGCPNRSIQLAIPCQLGNPSPL